MIRVAKAAIAALLAGVLILGVLEHRTADAAGPARPAASGSGPGSAERHSARQPDRATVVVSTIVAKVFASLAAGAGKSLAQVIAQDDPALGWLLPAAARRELLHAQQLAQVQQSLVSLRAQVTDLQHQLALDGFTNLVAHTNGIIGDIEHASKELVDLAGVPTDSPDAASRAAELEGFIRNNLLSAPEKLNAALAPKIPLASNLIESASRLVMQRDRFFGPSSSAQVMDVYSAYAALQAQLAVVLQNYYHATNPAKAQSNLATLRDNVEAQKKSLKPPVPENTVIDKKTHEMWTTNFPSGAGAPSRDVNLRTIAEIQIKNDVVGRRPHYVLLKPAGPTPLGGLPFANWKLPDVNRFKGLIDGWHGDNPLDWLQKVGGFNRGFLEAGDGRKWTDETPHVNVVLVLTTMDIRRFSLRTGDLQNTVVTWATDFDGWKKWFDEFRAGLIYYRPIPADEKYWF
jgi:hypothetical protein